MDNEIQKLYEVLSREGYYTKSIEDFQAQFDNQEYRDKVYGVVSRDGLYTKSRDEFESKYYKKKEFPQPLDSQSTGVQGDTSGSSDVIEERLKKSQQGNQDFYENYPTDTEMYDLQQGVASPEVLSKTYSWLSTTGQNTSNLTDEQLQQITSLKGVMKEQEQKLLEPPQQLGVTGMTGDLARDMEVAGQRARGEAVDGAPKREYERSYQFMTSTDDIMVSLQELQDRGEVFDFLDASEEEIQEYFARQESKKRRYDSRLRQYGMQGETVDEYEERLKEQTLQRARDFEPEKEVDPTLRNTFKVLGSKETYAQEDETDFNLFARTFQSVSDNQKSIFETEEEYKRRINKISDTELKNAEYRNYQKKLINVQKQIEAGILSENSIQVQDFTRLMAEDLGLDPNTATYQSISKSINETKDFLESRLFEKSLDRELYKKFLRDKEDKKFDFVYTRRATSDFVLGLIDDIAIYAADNFINDPITAERLQQRKASRNLRAQLALGHDPYDNRGMSQRMKEEGFWDETAWEKMMLSFGDSYISLGAAVVNPMLGVGIAGASGNFSTYEAYRDRGDITESEKQALAWGSGLIEAGITYIGMGNIRKARKALGVVDDIATATTSQKRKLYNAAIDKMRPISKRAAAAMQSSRVQAAGTFAFSVLEEEAEELSIGILTQGLAHVIADEDYDIYELADIAISTFGMSGGMSSINTYSTYSKYKNFETVATADKMERMESLKGLYEDLKKTSKEEGISKEEKAIIKEEMSSIREEILSIKAESIAEYDNLSEQDGDRIAAINRDIRKAARVAKKTDSPSIKDQQKRKIEKLLDIKAEIEGKSRRESIIDRGVQEAEILQSGKTVQPPETAEPQGVELQTASQLAQDLENKLEERKQKSAKKETAKDAVDTRVRYLNPATNETVEGVLIKDGQRLAVETDEGNIIDIENFEEVADQKLEDLNLSVAEGLLGVNEDGSFTYNRAGGVAPQGTKMVNRNGVRAIRRDKNGDVKNVLLTTPDGSRTFNLKGEEAQEAAYQILLKETQNADDVSKVDEELRLQAIEDARKEAEEEPRFQDNQIPVKREVIRVTDDDGSYVEYTVTTNLDGSLKASSISYDENGNENGRSFDVKLKDGLTALDAVKLIAPDTDVVTVESTQSGAEFINPKKIDGLTPEQRKRFDEQTGQKTTQPTKEAAKRAERRQQRKDNIETVGDVNLTEENRTRVSKMLDALSIVAPNLKVVMHSSRDSYNKTHPNANKDVGHWDGKNTIHILIDGTNPLNVEGYMLLKHEMIHPILETIIASDPEFANKIENRIKRIMNRYAKGTDAQKRVLDHYERYAKRSDQSLELLTEFIAVFSEPAGIKLLSRNRTAFEQIADLFQYIIDRVKGFRDAKIPSSQKEIIALAKSIGEALQKGSALDIDKTLNTARENAVRQSLERSSDPNKAYAPKQGDSLSEVMSAWRDSKNNFIIAQNLQHSFELRRMGFKEVYQEGGKIYMSVPVKYESFDASNNVAKIKSDSFMNPKDITQKPKKRVYKVLSELSKFSGYKIEFIDRQDLPFDSAMIVPDSENGLKETTVVVNLAYANARTGAAGLSMVVVETMRKKAPKDFNELYKDMLQNPKYKDLKSIFDKYVDTAPKSFSKADKELYAMSNVVHEMLDRVTTDAVGSGVNFLTDFQERLTNAIRRQEGNYKLERLPLGENMLLALESEMGLKSGKPYKLSDEADVEERKIIERIADLTASQVKSKSERFKRFYERLRNKSYPEEYTSKGYKQATILDAFEAAGFTIFTKEVRDYMAFQGTITDFLADDNLLEQIGNLYFSMIRVEGKGNASKIGFLLEYPSSDANKDIENSLSKEEKVVYEFFKDFLRNQPPSVRESEFANLDSNFGSVLKDFFANDNEIDLRIVEVIEHLTGDFKLARHANINERTFSEIREAYREVMVDENVDNSIDIFERVYQEMKKSDTKENIREKIKSAKNLREAIKISKLALPTVDINDAFTFRIEYDELKEYFPSEFKDKKKGKKKGKKKDYKGADTIYNEDAFMEIKIIPVYGKDGVFSVSYDVAYKGKLSGFQGFPTSWGLRNMTMPLVFKYVNLMGAIANARGITFTAVPTGINKEVVKDFGEEVYTPKELKRLKEAGSPVMRRGLNNATAFRNGYMVNAKRDRAVGIVLDGKLYKVTDNDVLSFVTSDHMEVTIKRDIEEGNLIDVAENIGESVINLNKTDLIEKIKNSELVDLTGKNIIAAALDINENSFTLPHAEVIANNYPMAAAFENSEKYVSLSGVRSMLSPDTKSNGRKTLESTDQMFQNAEEKIIGKGKGIKPFIKRYFSREALVTTSARLQKAMEKGFEDFIKAQFTALNGQRANADRDFKKIEKRVFGGLNTTEETILDKIIFLRRVIQIDTNWDNRLRENEASLQQSKNTVSTLEAMAKKAKTKSEKKQIKEEISRAKKAEKYYQQQVDKYSVRPLHPSDGTIEMNRENAIDALNTLQEDLGDSYTNLYGRADAYFDEYKKILQESYEAGLIDEETRDRFINDDYSPRVFLEKMFGETANAEFEHMNLGTDQIASIKNGSNQEIFTDARYLLNLSLRSLRHRTAHNSLFAAMDEQAAAMQYKMKDDTVREAKYKKDKAGNIIEDSFGNRETEKADEGYSNVFYRVDGKKRAFQIKSELYNALMGIEDRNLMSPKARRRAARVSGTSTKKALVTGLRPAFAFIASARGMVEVTRGRGVYDNLYFLPLMQMAALTDFLRSMPAAVMDGALVDDYFKHGGGMSFLTNQGRPEQIYKKKRSTFRRLLGQYSPLKGAGRALSFLGEKSEIALRLAIYTRTLKNLEKTRPELTETQRKHLAVEEARMIADFSQGGYLTKDLDSFKPYLNAAIQGTRGTLNYARKNPKMFAFKQIQAVAIHTASTVLAMMYLGDDEWEKIPAYIKNRYLLIPLFMKGDNGQPLFLRIPKAHQFMFLDHFAVMAGEAYYNDNQGKEYNWKMYEKDKNGDPTGYLSEQGFAMVDAFFGSLPAGDLIPEEVFTPKKLTLGNVGMQILSTMPAAGALDAYYNNIDRYRESRISYDKDKVPAYMEGYKDGRTRDIFKLTSKLFGGSDKRQQVAFEKLYANESSVIVNLMYQLTDAVITTAEEKEGIQRAEDRKRKIDASLGLKRSFIYEVPEKKYDNSKSKAFEDINKEERAKKKVIRTEIGILLKNNDFDSKEFGGFPKYLIDYVSKIPTEDVAMRRYARGYAKNRAIGFDTEPIFYEIANAETPAAQVEMLQIAYEFDKWNDLPVDVRNTIVEELVRAGLKDKRGLAAELRK